MSNPALLPPFEKFHGAGCLALMRRWWIRTREVRVVAGVGHRRLESWLRGKLPSVHFEGRGAVYDAMHELLVKQTGWAAREAVRVQAAHTARRVRAAA